MISILPNRRLAPDDSKMLCSVMPSVISWVSGLVPLIKIVNEFPVPLGSRFESLAFLPGRNSMHPCAVSKVKRLRAIKGKHLEGCTAIPL